MFVFARLGDIYLQLHHQIDPLAILVSIKQLDYILVLESARPGRVWGVAQWCRTVPRGASSHEVAVFHFVIRHTIAFRLAAMGRGGRIS